MSRKTQQTIKPLNARCSAVALSTISPNPRAFYKANPVKPVKIAHAKLKLSYLAWKDYTNGTEKALPLLNYVWQHDHSKIEHLLAKTGLNLQEIAQDMKEVCFTLNPVEGFSYYAGNDTIILNVWDWLFGPSPAGFLYKNLRFRPTFEQALILVHELEHHEQAKKAGMIGATEEKCSEDVERNFVAHEEGAFLKELEFTKAYAKVAPKLYKVQCCQLLGWSKQGDCKARFEATREDTQVMLSQTLCSIEDDLKFIHNGQQSKAEETKRNSAICRATSQDIQRKLKLKLANMIEGELIDIPFHRVAKGRK